MDALLPRDISRQQVIWACAIGAIGLGATWALRDYRAWIAFGTGGSSPTPSGYLKITKLRILRLVQWITFAQRDLRDPRVLDEAAARTNAPSYLGTLPYREGARPAIVSRIMPHRQVPEPIPESLGKDIMGLIAKVQSAHPDLLYVGPSETEGRAADAVHVRADVSTMRQPEATKTKQEVAHAHPTDKSLHVCLSPRDAAEVVRKAWGELFPLDIVPLGWILLYAPRNETELKTVEKIVTAGVPWMTGVDI